MTTLGTAQGTITVDVTPFNKAMRNLQRSTEAAAKAIGTGLRFPFLSMSVALWEFSNGPLRASGRPVRARKGKKVSGTFMWDGKRYRAVQRVREYGWVYCDQWERFPH